MNKVGLGFQLPSYSKEPNSVTTFKFTNLHSFVQKYWAIQLKAKDSFSLIEYLHERMRIGLLLASSLINHLFFRFFL